MSQETVEVTDVEGFDNLSVEEVFPNFCSIHSFFLVVMFAQLVAVVVFFASITTGSWQLSALFNISLFCQFVCLSSAVCLCLLRQLLASLKVSVAIFLAYAVILAVALFSAEMSYRLFIDFAYLGDVEKGSRHRDFLLSVVALCLICTALSWRYWYLSTLRKLQFHSETYARVQALQARIRPHFLFNSMNTIANLTRTDAELAERTVEDLAELFRATLTLQSPLVTLHEELDLARRYLNIEQLRLGKRLSLIMEVDELPMEALIPALTIQPLLENAVHHGVEPSAEGGTIRIIGKDLGDSLTLVISNPTPKSGAKQRHGNRIAQNNVRQRLKAFFGSKGKLEVMAGDEVYVLSLNIPYKRHAT